MRVFGRPIRRYIANLARAPQNARDVFHCMLLFRSPVQVLRSYVTLHPMPERTVELRSGLRIHLSGDPLDIVTVFGLFVRGDYGLVPSGSRVIDIGANIGVFTLYAVHCGARLVHAYEPSAESSACLRRNVEANALGTRVNVFQVAVGAAPERVVRFPRASSVLNAIATDARAADDCDDVPLETLRTVVDRIGGAELLKLDCEGEEEHILSDADAETLSRVAEVRLEYHHSRGAAVAKIMRDRGFSIAHWWAPNAKGGIAWFVLRRGGEDAHA